MTFEEIREEVIRGREARRDAWREAIREEVIRGKERISEIFPVLGIVLRWKPKEREPKGAIEMEPEGLIEKIIGSKPQYNNPNTVEGAVLGRGMGIVRP